jgi:hypothetical protein
MGKPSGKTEAEIGAWPTATPFGDLENRPDRGKLTPYLPDRQLCGRGAKKLDFAPCAPFPTLIGWLMAVLD